MSICRGLTAALLYLVCTAPAAAQQIDLTCSAASVRAAQSVDCEASPNDASRYRHYWIVEDLDGRTDLRRYWPSGHNRDPHYRVTFRRHGDYLIRVGIRPRYEQGVDVDWSYLDWPLRVTEPWYDRRWLGVPWKWWIGIAGGSAVAINCAMDRGRLC